jgi:Flp pilus assembly protein CpaB
VAQIDTRPTVTVLVAKKRINAWTLLSDKPGVHFLYKEIPESEVPRKALREFADLKDMRVNRPINEEAFVTTDDLGSKELYDFPPIKLPPGYRAVTIRVSHESVGGGGFLIPGSRVNVVWTKWPKEEGISQTILRNMLVLAIELRTNKYFRDTSPLVTLAVSAEDADHLALAACLGDFELTYYLP